jgi:hypothetical protein
MKKNFYTTTLLNAKLGRFFRALTLVLGLIGCCNSDAFAQNYNLACFPTTRPMNNAKSLNTNRFDDFGFVMTKLLKDNSETAWLLENGSTFTENGDGTATLRGTIKQFGDYDTVRRFMVNLTFSGQSFTEPAGGAYNQTGVPTADWYYFNQITGVMNGLDGISGGRLEIALYSKPAQVGTGGNQIPDSDSDRTHLGLSAWFQWRVTQQPTTGLGFNNYIEGTTVADMNFLLGGLPTLPCNTNLCINDRTAPVFRGCPTNLILNASSSNCAVANWRTPTATDNCDVVNLSLQSSPTESLTSGDCFPLGLTNLVYTARDSTGNESYCAFSVEVLPPYNPCGNDILAPRFQNCPADIATTTTTNCGVVNWTEPIATDDCLDPRISFRTYPTVGLTNGGCFPVGTTTVEYIARDSAGLTDTCRFNVVVTRTVAPCREFDALSTATNCGTGTTYGLYISGKHYRVIRAKFTRDDAAGTAKLIGTYVLDGVRACVDVEFSGFTATAPQNSPKRELCIGEGFDASAWVYYTAVTGTVRVGDESQTISRRGPAFQMGRGGNLQDTNRLGFSGWFNWGTQAGDFNFRLENERNCTPTLTCDFDCSAPVVVCPAPIRVSSALECALVQLPAFTATDNCASSDIVIVSSVGTYNTEYCFPAGATTPVIYSVTDPSGNVTKCTFTVEVVRECREFPATNTISSCGAGEAYGMWLDGKHWRMVSSKFQRFDANGTAKFKALFRLDNRTAVADVVFSGFTNTPPDAMSPKKMLCIDSTFDASSWSFYPTITGTLTVDGISNPITRKGPAFQTGIGANLQDKTLMGFSGWFFWGNIEGDFNFRLGAGTTCSPINPCDFDTLPPSLVCPQNITRASSDGNCVNTVLTTPIFSDNCGVPTLRTNLGTVGGNFCFTVGTRTVTYTATDLAGNTASCSFIVTVTPPAPVADNCSTTRTRSGLVALYDFKEGSGNKVYDRSGYGAPLNLTIGNTAVTQWESNSCGLSVNDCVLIKSDNPATKIATAVAQTNALTLEVWVKASNLTQTGPARIFTYSENTGARNFTLGQDGGRYIARLKTSQTTGNGLPTVGANGTVSTTLQHVVYTFSPDGKEKMYINGVLKYEGTRTGQLNNWQAHCYLAIANELTGDRPWLGKIYLAAIYNRTLSVQEVGQNYTAGVCCTPTNNTNPNACTEKPGALLREWWEKSPDWSSPVFIPNTKPSGAELINQFSFYANNGNWKDNYVSRTRGYITAPVSGWYKFNISGDDNVDLYLSTNDQPAQKQRIASICGWTNNAEWSKYTTQYSRTIYLNQGKKYYIELTQLEGGGGDHFNVRWQVGSCAWAAIPSRNLTSYCAPAGTTSNYSQRVTRIDLDAQSEGSSNKIEWVNNSGDLNDVFVVQKANTMGEFEDLTLRDGRFEGSQKHFIVLDSKPFEGENSYRVKLILKDGKEQFSEIKTVNKAPLHDIQVFPNPATDYTDIDLSHYKGQDVQVRLYNAQGLEVLKEMLEKQDGMPYRINLSEFPAGAYTLRVVAQGKREAVRKLIVTQ